MARQLLLAAGPGVTGPWVRVEGGGKRSVPMRIQATGTFAIGAGDTFAIIIEELVGGTPGNGSHSPYPPQSDTGTVEAVGTISVAGDDLLVEDPIAYIRARTGPAMSNTVVYCGAEMLE